MAKYYNTTRNALPITLRNKKAVIVPAKSWLEVTVAEDGSESIMRSRANGDLKMSKHVADIQAPASHVAPKTVTKAPVKSGLVTIAAPVAAPIPLTTVASTLTSTDVSTSSANSA